MPTAAPPQEGSTTTTKPRRKAAPKKVVAEKTESQLRDELFEVGSEFRPTYRSEVVGIDNVLGEIEEVIHWLKNSKAYQAYNSRLQPGIIFEGKPGTGKTLVSRYIATASEATFINVRDFPHKHALFSDADIRDLFKRSRAKYKETGKPVILFWDEFENAAVERGSDSTSPDQAATVSQLTAELDGIHGKNEGLLLIGCTNYIHDIDHALRRRGRMGVHIEFHAPDRGGKKQILEHYLATTNTVGEIDTDMLSYFFDREATAADIEEACVEAWRRAVRRCLIEDEGAEPYLIEKDLVSIFIKQLVGPPTTFILPEEEQLQVAVHECGHAISALIFGRPLRLITVQPGKKSFGRVMTDEIQQYVSPISSYYDAIRVSLGSICAEQTAGLDPLVGATGDIAKASSHAAFLVDELGVGLAGLMNPRAVERGRGYSRVNPEVSNETVFKADAAAESLLSTLRREVQSAINNVGKDSLWKIANAVNERVTMTGAEFEKLFLDVTGHDPSYYLPLGYRKSL